MAVRSHRLRHREFHLRWFSAAQRGHRSPDTQPLTSNRLDFDDAVEAIEYYFQQGWTDGLPVVPPTPDRVQQFLDYVGLAPAEILGMEPTRGRVITAEKVAINAVMAGCLPEYFPVVPAAIDAICEPKFNLHAITASTMGAAVLMVVNGPIAKDLGINSGVSVFGPGHRPNATIGRAIRLIISNVTGAVSGELDKATLGHPGKYTWCIAESEDVSPWEPLHVERGLSPEQSAVTVFAGLSSSQVPNHEGNSPETILPSFGDAMFAAGYSVGEIVIVLCPEHIGNIEAAGWSKAQVKQFLCDMAQRKVSDWIKAGEAINKPADLEAMVGVVDKPENITVVVAGGPAGAFSAVTPLWGAGIGSQSVTKQIIVPS